MAHPARAPVAASSIPALQVSVFARGSSKLYNPDGVVVTNLNVFVDYQNNSDTVNGAPSIIVKYSRTGTVQGQVPLIGRCDGLRMNPRTGQLWALLNNDGMNSGQPRQPLLYTIDPTTLKARLYNFPKVQPHGGGYDDIAFVNGRAFISASSPVLTSRGINNKPAVLEVTLSGGNANIAPVVWGNTYGYDIVSGKFEQLNITDPDSMQIDSHGDLVLTSEGDAQLIFIKNPGARTQGISRLAVGTQLDESAWTTGTTGTLFVAHDSVNVVYAIGASFPAGTIFSEAAQGAPVGGFLGTLDPTTGFLTPLLTARGGVVNPTTLVFFPLVP